MDIFLGIFFFLLSSAGVVLGSNAGTFAGLTLFSLQIVKILKDNIIGLIVVIVAGVTGIVFFTFKKEWLLLLLFIVVHSYNYWLYINLKEN